MDTVHVNFKIKYRLLIISLLLTGLCAFLCVVLGNYMPWLKDIMLIIAAGIALTGILYSARSLHYSAEINAQKLIHEKKVFSAQLIAEWNRPEMAKLTILAAGVRKDLTNVEPKKIIETLKENTEVHSALASILNFFERVAICIENEIADEDTLKKFFRGMVLNYFSTLKGLINHKRIELENPRIGLSFENLAQKWGQ